jgi:O-antigen/teichoic acid export membrane protein
MISGNNLQGTKMYARNTAFNFMGQLVPMSVGIVAIPQLIRCLGTERFGILTIAWMLIGYFGLFDMGLNRALTQLVAERLGRNEADEIPAIFWTSTFLMFILGIAGALVLALITPFLVHTVLRIPSSLQSETLQALYILAVSIPFAILTSALVGLLSAYQRFDIINAIRMPMGIYTYAGPLAVLPFSNRLVPVFAVLAVGRIAFFFIHLHYCLRTVPRLKEGITFQRSIMKPLFSFGGWMTVSNIIGPLMVNFDRFLIGSVISVTAVAYYTTPYEFVTKLFMVPASLLNVLFPAFAAIYTQDSCHAAQLFRRAVTCLLLCIFPVVLIIVAGAHQGLALWLGGTFADNSYRVLQWLAIGVLLNCMAQVPFTFIQSIGKPDITSKLHIVELIIYLPLVWFMVKRFGIEGAAVAWLIRMALDATLLYAIACRTRNIATAFPGIIRYGILAAVLFLLLVMAISNPRLQYAVGLTGLVLFVIVSWRVMLSMEERNYLKQQIAALHKLAA